MIEESTLNRYVSGPETAQILDAVFSEKEGAGAGRNPVLLYGARGTGKTFLLKHVMNAFSRERAGCRIEYLTGWGLQEKLIAAIRGRGKTEFVSSLTKCDLLLLDEIQVFAERPRTWEEVAMIVKHCCEGGTKVIVAADAEKGKIEGTVRWMKHALDLMSAGIMIELPSPDRQRKYSILKKRFEVLGVTVPDDVNRFLVGQSNTDNLCRLARIVNRIEASNRFRMGDVTLPWVKSMIRHGIA